MPGASSGGVVHASRFLRVVPGIFIALGILSCLQMAFMLATGHISVLVSIFCIPVGIGLRQFKHSSYRWARVWAIVTIIGCLLGVVLCRYSRWTWNHQPWYPAASLKITVAIAFGLAALLMYQVDRTLRALRPLYQPSKPYRLRHPPLKPTIVYGEKPPGR